MLAVYTYARVWESDTYMILPTPGGRNEYLSRPDVDHERTQSHLICWCLLGLGLLSGWMKWHIDSRSIDIMRSASDIFGNCQTNKQTHTQIQIKCGDEDTKHWTNESVRRKISTVAKRKCLFFGSSGYWGVFFSHLNTLSFQKYFLRHSFSSMH